MKLWKSGLLAVASAGALVLAGLAAPAVASGDGGHRGNVITVADRCDPATFNAMFGAGTCMATPGTHVTVGVFLATLTANPARVLAKRDAVGWENEPYRTRITQGQDLVITNTGGETHTFTRVAKYGGGCLPPLNAIFGLAMYPGSATDFGPSTILPGATLHVSNLAVGKYKFECLVHPWMRTDVRVKAAHNENDDD